MITSSTSTNVRVGVIHVVAHIYHHHNVLVISATAAAAAAACSGRGGSTSRRRRRRTSSSSSSFSGGSSRHEYKWTMRLRIYSPTIKLSFDVGVPVVLYLIVCSSWQP